MIKVCYIYQIRNILNGRIYIGSTINFHKRKIHHLHLLRKQIHHSIKLQRAWNKYGENSFVFEILEEKEIVNYNDQIILEQKYLNEFLSFKIGYNGSITSKSSGANVVWTEEMKRKMGEKLSKIHKGKTPKNFLSLRNFSRRPIQEYENGIYVKEYESISQATKELNLPSGTICSILTNHRKTCRKYPNKNWKYKDGLPPKTPKISLNRKPSTIPNRIIYLKNEEEIKFESAKKAAIFFKVGVPAIGWRCRKHWVDKEGGMFRYE